MNSCSSSYFSVQVLFYNIQCMKLVCLALQGIKMAFLLSRIVTLPVITTATEVSRLLAISQAMELISIICLGWIGFRQVKFNREVRR